MNERTDECTDKRTENLPILQDFVPFRSRCPKRHGLAGRLADRKADRLTDRKAGRLVDEGKKTCRQKGR